MAGTSVYKDDGDDEAAITDINVTPFVDVVLVLLIIFMVTTKLIVTRGIEVDRPTSSIGRQVKSTLRVTVDPQGTIYVNNDKIIDDADAVRRISTAVTAMTAAGDPSKVIITGDTKAAYGGVMHAMELAKQAGVASITLENVAP